MVRVNVSVPLEPSNATDSGEMSAPGFGGQSKLVVPNDGTGDRPLPSHSRPALGPSEQWPPFMPSLTVASPWHTGQGVSIVRPLYTREVRFNADAKAPVSAFAVPVTLPFTWLVTQVGTPPAESASGAPKKKAHLP